MSAEAEVRLFLSALLLLFIALKIAHVIAWSWWWVFAPLWAPALFAGLLMLVAALLMAAERYW